MKTLRQILEVTTNHYTAGKQSIPFGLSYPKSKKYQTTRSSLGHHEIEHAHTSITPTQNQHEILAMDDDGKARLKLTAHSDKGTPHILKIADLAASEGNQVGAHDLYHHLITNHGFELHGSDHSEGAKRIWHKLARNPDIRVTGIHTSGKEVTIPHGTFEMFHQHAYHPGARIKTLVARRRK